MSIGFWIGFNLFVLLMLMLDLGLLHRKAHEVKFKEAAAWSVLVIALALGFNVWIYFYMGHQAALEFLTCYLIEESLSVDNLFIFYVLFSAFRVKRVYQHKVLFWGILGALIMRGIFIAAGITLLEKFHWAIYLFGGILIVTGIKMFFQKEEDMHPEDSWFLKLMRRVLPVSEHRDSGEFFVQKDNRWLVTPLFIVLLSIEFTDLVFALDSIPAVLAFSREPFIVYTSNVFAILGLRSLYFVIAHAVPKLQFLHYGLSAIITIVGIKMLVSHYVKIPIGLALGVTAGILVITIAASLLIPQPPAKANK